MTIADQPQPVPSAADPSALATLPASYQELFDYFTQLGEAKPFELRIETFKRIERITERPLLCYVAKTHNLPPGVPAYIDDSDLTGISDLAHSVSGSAADIFVVNNGGSAEATERIVTFLRGRFKTLRFILAGNAYSAATLMALAADEVLMTSVATLGPIDPQINGIPARAILRAFERIEKRLKEEGPRALSAYMPLISKYDLHIFEICRSAEELSEELARTWLARYMLRCDQKDDRVDGIVKFFISYDIHKSHGRSIGRERARELGLPIKDVEEIAGLEPLVRSLFNQYQFWFDKTAQYKVFENAYGINWGRQAAQMALQVPFATIPAPQPGPPERSG
jgi:hypothetical protein